MNVPCSVPAAMIDRLPRGDGTAVLSIGGFEVDVVAEGADVIDRREVSIPEELLERRMGSIDDGARFGFFVEYWLGGERVHRSEATCWEKGKMYLGPRYSWVEGHPPLVAEDGTIAVDYHDGQGIVRRPVAGLLVRKIDEDGPEEYVQAIEFYEPGRVAPVHRSARVFKKVVPSMTGEQGRMS